MVKKYLKIIPEYGIDIVVMVILWILLKPSMVLSAIMLLYSIMRIFFIRHIFVIVFVNATILYSIVSNSMKHPIHMESEIVVHSVITVLLLILAAIQVFVILFKVFSIQKKKEKIEYEVDPSFIKRLYYGVYDLHHLGTIILASIYPIILTFVIIVAFSGVYNSANTFYELRNIEESGLIYSDNGELLDTITLDGHMVASKELKGLLDKDYIYFSTITYFTIGYGDIVPVGLNMKIIVMLEMLIAHILNISIFALFGTLFYEFIKHGNTKRFKHNPVQKVSSLLQQSKARVKKSTKKR